MTFTFYDNVNSNELMNMYIYESQQLLEQLEQRILNCEESCCFQETDINEIFRIMHTIKGSSALMHLSNIEMLAHSVEDLFDYLRETKSIKYDASLLSDLVLEAVDFIKVEIVKVKNNDQADGDFSQLTHKIRIFLDELQSHKQASYKAILFFEDDCGMESVRAYAVLHELQNYGDIVHTQPEQLEENGDCINYIQSKGFTILFNSDFTYDEILSQLNRTIFLKQLELIKTSKAEHPNNSSNSLDNDFLSSNTSSNINTKINSYSNSNHMDSTSKPMTTRQNLISVDVSKLDALMDLAGELVISEAMVTHHPSLDGLDLGGFYKAAAQLHKITNDLQDMIMSIRMMPLSIVFNRMNRIIRDMCKELEKEADLILIGEETEVDKNIIEHISDPIMHIIRNAADHGLEKPHDREAIGKNRSGTIVLEARNSGGDVIITIKDDGKGLDKESILAKAKENGLITRPEHELTDKDIYSLIMLPGFSTKDTISEFSGRGVGMDVVANNIEAIGGTVSIDSNPGHGTTFTLKLPLTLAIIDGMNIQVGESKYTIPITSIIESFRAGQSDIFHTPDGNEMVMVRGECYSVIRLYQRLKVETQVTDLTEGIFVMLESDDRYVCIFADVLLGEQQVVVKPLPEYITNQKEITALAGCTLLGDGSISMILNISGLINKAG